MLHVYHAQTTLDILRNQHRFVDRDHIGRNRRIPRGNTRLRSHGRLIGQFIQLQSAPVHPGADTRANSRRVLANTAAKDDRIGAAEHGQVGAEVLAGTMAKRLNSEVRTSMAFCFQGQQFLHVSSGTGQTQKASAVIQAVIQLGCGDRATFEQMQYNACIEIARPGGHD